MKHPTSQDRSRRADFSRTELNRLLFRVLVRNTTLSSRFRSPLYSRIKFLSPVQIRNRCVLTGRAGSPLSRFRLSRITFRQLANSGQLSGVGRSSWLGVPFFNCSPLFLNELPPESTAPLTPFPAAFGSGPFLYPLLCLYVGSALCFENCRGDLLFSTWFGQSN